MKKIYKVNNIFSEAFLGGGRSFRLTERRSGSRISRTKPALTMLALLLVCLFGVNESAWGATATLNQSSKKGFGSTTGITFSISGLGNWTNKDDGRLSTTKHCAGYPVSKSSNAVITWSGVATGKCVNISKVEIKGTVASGTTLAFKNKKMYAYTSVSTSNTTIQIFSSSGNTSAQSGSISGDTYLKDIGNNGSITMYSNDNPFYIESIVITYTIDNLPTFTFKINGSTAQTTYGAVTLSFDNSTYNSGEQTKTVTGVKLSTTSATQNIYFKATPVTGCQFKGWFDNSSCTGDAVSKETTYGTSLTNSNSGSTVSKTLYAKFDNMQPQTITWNQTVNNQIRGNEITLNATASSGLGVYYTASSTNGATVSISGNKITCLTAGTIKITAHQDGNAQYYASSNNPTKTFTIAEHQITKNPTATGITYEQTLSNSTLSGGTANVEGTWAWKYPNSVPGAGKADQIAVFTPTSSAISAYPLECNVSVTVAKATPDVPCTIANSYEVDDAPLDLQTLWTREGNGTITYSKVSFTQTGSNNDGATTPAITDNRYLSLGQAGNLRIQMAIAEGSNYVARTVTKDITINKRPNTIKIKGVANYSSSIYVDSYDNGLTLTSDNTDYTNCPITITQTAGKDIATFYQNDKVVYSSYKLGTATWTLSQPENYKYVADNGSFTVNVVKALQPTCYVVDHPSEQEVSSLWWEGEQYCDAIALNGIGESLVSFEAKRDGGTGDVSIVQYSKDNGQNWTTLRSAFGISNDFQKFGPFAFPALSNGERITHIRFGISGTTSGIHYRYKNIKVSRKKWFKLEDKDGVEISSLTMPTNTLGGNHTTAKFTVDYSTCADQIKVVSNHPHITVSPASFASEGNGTKEITVTYAWDDPEVIDGVITVYTPYENKTLNVHATTEKKSQAIEWSELFAGEPVSLPQTFTSNDAASATSKLPVKYNSGDPEIIAIAEDSLSFTIVGTGATTLTATQAGNDEWKSVSDSKTINASNKKIQRIVWNQQFTRSLSVGNEIPLTARVYVMNVAEGAETESPARTEEIVYTCPDANGVIEILNGTNIRVIGYGNTTITASVAGNEEYEAAASVTLPVRVREIQTGDCDMPLVFEQASEIEFFQSNTNEIIGTPIAINHANGTPDKLSFDVRGAAWKLGVEYYKGSIQVQQSTDNKLSWSSALATVSPAKNSTASSGEVQLDPNATHIRFVRPSGGQGYHYVGNIQITRLPYITTEEAAINLGNVSVGENREFTIPVSYANVKGNMNVTRLYADNGLTVESAIEAECGDMDSYNLQASVLPQSVGPWTNTVAVQDPLSGMFANIVINATIQKGSQTITWNPTLDILTTETPTLNAVASSGLTVSYAVTSGNNTVARIEGGQVVILQPGQFTIMASQGGNVNYNAAESVAKTFTVTAETLTLIGELTASDITYGQTLLSSTLTGASAEDSKGNAVEGTFSWKTATTAPNAGDAQEFAVVFTPSTNAAWYSTLETTAAVNVAKANATLSWTSAPTPLAYNASATYTATSASDGDITYSIISGDSYAHIDANTGALTIDVPGNTITIQASQAEGTNHNVPTPITVDVVINAAPVNEFTNAAGDGDWQNPANWTSVPTGSEPNVIVSGALEIDENVTVGNLTIENTGSIAVITGGTLTVKGTSEDRSEYGDVHVLNDGAIHLGSSADLQVRHFTLDAKLAGKNILDVKEAAASGQVDSVSNLHVNGDAYFQMTFDPKGKISFGWYDFVVPFPVNISDGIYREGNLTSHLVSGVDFLVQEYSETRNANKQKAWSNFYGTLQPGRVYTITFNYDPNFDQNVFVFKKASGAAIGGPMEFATQYTAGSGDTDDCGWNGLGNGTLQHGYITGTYAKMQVYNHAENKYDLLTGKNPSFAVGTSFFVQVGEAHPTMEWNKTEDYDVNPLYAPKREAVEVEEFLLSLRGENQVDASDHLYFSGSEEATKEYVIGHDLRKMGNPTEAKTTQMWATKNGKNLCDIETRMENYSASSDINFYAPQAGTYELTVEEMPDNATLYLTKNGRVVWNLSMSPYELDLTKGTTEGYGLRIVADRQTTTDVENAETENGSVRKVLIDDKIYIVTPEGKMYDIVGKGVKF
jgi:hypothetical protein